MLYVTTRSVDAQYPALRTLGQDCGPDGGRFVPFRLPVFTEEEMGALKDKSFGRCMAQVMNRLFFPALDGIELDFALGRNPVRIAVMNHRIAVAELWHNIHWSFDWVAEEVTRRLRVPAQQTLPVTEWAAIAVRIGSLFGVFGQLQRAGITDAVHGVDVAVAAGDFTMPMAVWYAREMGLPICSIVCSDRRSGCWDLLHHGEVRTAEPLPVGVERLISGRLGAEETVRYHAICQRGGIYVPEETALETLRQGMFATVISPGRTEKTIASVYRTNRYLMGVDTAQAYAGLQDHRATVGEGRTALLLAERRPVSDLETVAAAVGLNAETLRAQLE